MAATNRARALKSDTREYVQTALMGLLVKHRLPQVTVSQVCKRAGVSRMAFYRNFDGLEQVIYVYYLGKLEPIFELLHESMKFEEKYNRQLELFDTIGQDMVKSVRQGYEHVVRRVFTDQIREFYAGVRDIYSVEFIASGVYSIWTKWLVEGRSISLRAVMQFLKNADSLPNVNTALLESENVEANFT